MSTLTSILSTDLISDSRSTINTNFGNLNASKVESSTLTGSYSTTSTLLGQYMTPSTVTGTFAIYNQVVPSVLTLEPMTPANGFMGIASTAYSSNTTGYAGLFNFPQAIQFNNFSLSVNSVLVGGQLKFGWYTEDGQTLISSMMTSAYATKGQKTENVSSVRLNPGNYYTVCVPQSSVSVKLEGGGFTAAPGAIASVTGKSFYAGTMTVTANTLPTNFVPSSLAPTSSVFLYRLDQ